jgi:hypothetical protein
MFLARSAAGPLLPTPGSHHPAIPVKVPQFIQLNPLLILLISGFDSLAHYMDFLNIGMSDVFNRPRPGNISIFPTENRKVLRDSEMKSQLSND